MLFEGDRRQFTFDSILISNSMAEKVPFHLIKETYITKYKR